MPTAPARERSANFQIPAALTEIRSAALQVNHD